MRSRILGLLAGALALLVANSSAQADLNTATFNWAGNGGTGTVNFQRSGGNLIVTLNYLTMPTGTLGNSNLLGGLFFDFTGASSLSATSAWSGLGTGGPAIFVNGAATPSNPFVTNGSGQVNLSGEFAARANVHGFDYGLASVGYTGTFGHGDLLDSSSSLQYSHSSPPDGADFQLTASTFSYANYGPNDVDFAINTTVIFTLGNLNADLDLGAAGITGQVQFGTGFAEPHVDFGPSVPAPAGILLLGMGGVLTGVYSWRRKRQLKVA